MPKARIELLVTDVDNTLFDWVRSWACAVRPMIAAVAESERCDAGTAEKKIRDVHRAWGATECPACLASVLRDASRMPAIVRQYHADFVACAPAYADVGPTLGRIRQSGARVVACTESRVAPTRERLALLGLASLFDGVYGGQEKPDPGVLRRIAADAQVAPERVLYVGDNLWKDVRMAERAGVHSAWARYGTARRLEDEGLLMRLCHWTPADSDRERTASEAVKPSATLENGLSELFDWYSFC